MKYSIYSRPNFNANEWSIVNRRKHSEFNNPKFDLDTDRKWMYSKEKGYTVFAIYSKYDAEDPTVLYGSSGKKAEQDYAKLNRFFEEGQRYAGNNRATVDRILNDIKSSTRNASNGISPAGGRGTADGDVFLPFGESGSDRGRNYVDGTENLKDDTLNEYNDEASGDPGAFFVTFSNDYATIRNFMKEGGTAEEADIAPTKYSLFERGDDIAPMGDYHYYGNEFGRDFSSAETAPVTAKTEQNVPKAEDVAPVMAEAPVAEDIAPVNEATKRSEVESVVGNKDAMRMEVEKKLHGL